MALAGEIAKYIGGELVKNTGRELSTNATTSALANLAPKIATKAGASMANKIGNELIAGSVLDKLIPTNRMLDKAGRPVTLYHSTPNNFDKFDDNMLGSNTGYDNTALGHFVTPDKDFSKRFIDIDNVGKTGRTMELQGNIQKPITHPYMAGYKYDNKDLDKIVEDYLLATDNPEFLEELRGYALDDNSNLYDEYMGLTMADSPFEVAGSDRQSLMNKGYDAVEIVEGPKSGLVDGARSNAPISSYAVFNGENLRPVRHLPINQVSNTEEVPVSTLRNLFRGQLYSDTDFSYNSPSMNSGDSAGSQALGGAYHFTPDEDKANAWADNAGGGVIKIGYKPDQLLKAEDAKRMIQEAAGKLNDGAYMSKLWQTDPELAEQIELVGIGNLEALAKREGKPFVEHINANDDELGTIYYYKDVDEGLTEKFREQFRKTKAEKYLGKPKIQQPDAGLSPQQQEFFKDSVVRDENGELIPMYHGSNSNFTVFDKSKSGQSNKSAKVGFWFTPNKEGAEKWAGQSWWGDNNPKVYETYLNIKNPFVYEQIDNSSQIARLEEQLKMVEDELKSTYKGSLGYYDAYKRYNAIANQIEDLSYTDPYEQFRSHIYAMEGKSPSQANTGGVGMVMDNEDEAVRKYVEMLKKEEYDGIIIKGTNYDRNTMGSKNDQYVVFDPEQIKNVDNKKPTKNKDIRYAIAAALGLGSIIGPYMNSQKSVDNTK